MHTRPIDVHEIAKQSSHGALPHQEGLEGDDKICHQDLAGKPRLGHEDDAARYRERPDKSQEHVGAPAGARQSAPQSVKSRYGVAVAMLQKFRDRIHADLGGKVAFRHRPGIPARLAAQGGGEAAVAQLD